MEAGKNSVIYMGLILGPNKADDTCGRTTVTGTMDRGFTVYTHTHIHISGVLSAGTDDFRSLCHITKKNG
jgi:hypothetical protein